MDVVVERCAGLDVHRDDVVATVRVPAAGRRRWDQQTRTFRATLGGLADRAAWLAEFGVTLVGMEATGVYWKTVFQALEERGRVLAAQRTPLAQRGVGDALLVLSVGVLEQSRLFGCDLDS